MRFKGKYRGNKEREKLLRIRRSEHGLLKLKISKVELFWVMATSGCSHKNACTDMEQRGRS